ncbi:hypothetical protein [Nocardia sp. NPDC004722]
MNAATVPRPAAACGLPSKTELHLALCDNTIASPLCAAVHALTDWHRVDLAKTCPPDATAQRERTALLQRIDAAAVACLPPAHPGAHTHPESLATMFERLAVAAAEALTCWQALGGTHPAMHAAWTALAELELRYADLTADLATGHLRLPPFVP